MKRKVLFLKGIPGSGKSTYAKELVKSGWKRVNKDDLRNMLDNGQWSKKNEELVKIVRDEIIMTALDTGYNVVVDDTNIEGNHIQQITDYVNSFYTEDEITFETKFFDTPVGECIRRDALRPNPVGTKVIRRMYDKVKSEYFPKIEFNPDLPTCIIVDIDGTLAHNDGARGWYEYDKVHLDTVDETVKELVWTVIGDEEYNRTYVVIVSGRSDECQAITEKWLEENDIPYEEIYMRQAGDQREDSIVKQEIFDKYIRHRYNVKFVLDDRDRVVEMWRKNGLKVLQVEEGQF